MTDPKDHKQDKSTEKLNGLTPREYYWRKFTSPYYTDINPSSLGDEFFSEFIDFEPIERVYITQLIACFDCWMWMQTDYLYAIENKNPATRLERVFSEQPKQKHRFKKYKDLVYDDLFKYIYKESIEQEDICNELNLLLEKEEIPFTHYFDASCCYYMLATRFFQYGSEHEPRENMYSTAMYEAILSLNEFQRGYNNFQDTLAISERKKNSSRGGKVSARPYQYICDEIVRLLQEEIEKGLYRFDSKMELTKILEPKIKEFIGNKPLPADLLRTMEKWSGTQKPEIIVLYNLLVKRKSMGEEVSGLGR
ncbi:conserved hypothetical protein [Enterobacterales bacterium 8AC]|nr:conserved hypothetical protein [Enterobacterales bacterium 8AC]